MGTGPILPTLVTLALPAATAGITQTLFEVVDVWFISQLGKAQISGTSLVGPWLFTMFAIAQAVNVGISALLSRRLGQKRPDLAREVLNHGMLLALAVGSLFTIISFAFIHQILAYLGGDSQIIVHAGAYASIVFAGIFFMYIGSAADSALRAQGNTVTPMKISITANVLNIFLDWLLIWQLGYGVRGAAIATVIGRAGMAIALVSRLWSRHSEVRPGVAPGQPFVWRWPVVGQLYWLGAPASVGMGAMSVSIIFINKLLVGMNAYAIGMLGIAFRIEMFAFTPVFGLFSAVVPMVGYNLGAKLYHRCARTIWSAATLAGAGMAVLGAVIFIFPRVFFGLFSQDPELLPMGVEYLRIQMPVYPIIGLSIMMSAGYQGLGLSWLGMLSQLWRNLVLKLPCAYWFAAVWGLTGIWWSFPVSTACSAGIFVTIMYIVLRRLKRSASQEPPEPDGRLHQQAAPSPAGSAN